MIKPLYLPVVSSACVAAFSVGLISSSVLTSGRHSAGAARAAEAGIQIAPGLVLPPMDPANGRKLFGSKGCVICHSVNGVGGTDAPPIDASTMEPEMSPFDFVAKMWNHSQGMIAMQMNELGHQITFRNGEEIANIIAFLHNAAEQKKFTEADIPAAIKKHIEEDTNTFGAAKSKQ